MDGLRDVIHVFRHCIESVSLLIVSPPVTIFVCRLSAPGRRARGDEVFVRWVSLYKSDAVLSAPEPVTLMKTPPLFNN